MPPQKSFTVYSELVRVLITPFEHDRDGGVEMHPSADKENEDEKADFWLANKAAGGDSQCSR